MALHIIVTAKQVSDPEMPISAYRLDAAGPRVVTPATFQPVINGFDENALEAALRPWLRGSGPTDQRTCRDTE